MMLLCFSRLSTSISFIKRAFALGVRFPGILTWQRGEGEPSDITVRTAATILNMAPSSPHTPQHRLPCFTLTIVIISATNVQRQKGQTYTDAHTVENILDILDIYIALFHKGTYIDAGWHMAHGFVCVRLVRPHF